MSRCSSQLLLRTQNTVLPFSEVWYHLLICGFSWPIRDPRSRATKTPKSTIPVLQGRHEPDVWARGRRTQRTFRRENDMTSREVNVTARGQEACGYGGWGTGICPAYSCPQRKESRESVLAQARGGHQALCLGIPQCCCGRSTEFLCPRGRGPDLEAPPETQDLGSEGPSP